MQKNKLIVALLFGILVVGLVPFVSAGIYGNGSPDGVSSRLDSDQFWGGKFTFLTSGSDTNLSYVQFYGMRYGSNSYVKACLVADSDKSIVATSETILPSVSAGWNTLNFLSGYTLTNNTVYYMLFIANGTGFYINYATSASTFTKAYDMSNLFSTPFDPTDILNPADGYIAIKYVTVNGATSGGPTVAPSTDDWTTSFNTALDQAVDLLVPLLFMLIPAFFGWKFMAAWGFLAGLNIGAILCYVILGAAVFPLWGVVALLILDALLLFGKVGLHQ